MKINIFRKIFKQSIKEFKVLVKFKDGSNEFLYLKVPSNAQEPELNNRIETIFNNKFTTIKITGKLFEHNDFDGGKNVYYWLKYYIGEEINFFESRKIPNFE
jgi:hypothetical protein